MFESIEKYLSEHQPAETAPVYNSNLLTAMAHQGILHTLEEALVMMSSSAEAEKKSPIFTKLCIRRYALTGRFNPVIAGEMSLELGKDLETIVTEKGMDFQATQGYSNRLPYDHLGKDGDYIDGLLYQTKNKS